MTIADSSAKNNSNLFSGNFKVCLVTGQASLSQNILEHLKYSDIKTKDRLADLIGDQDCWVYIIDTAVRDMDIWPVPLLTIRNPESKLWLFLVSRLSDANRFEMLPPKAKYFNRNELKMEELLDYVERQLDPESGKRIEGVHYLEKMNSFVIHMENGNAYILKVSDLSEADTSGVDKYTVEDDYRSFRVIQPSGNWFDVPWDDVLYHCEPTYTYYKGKNSLNKEQATQSIGQKIRQIRLSKGYSIEALAEKASMKRPNLSRLENGKHQPSLETLEHLAEALEMTVAEILTNSKPIS
jgi:DNA-binding XRE family transcriptional regulator